MNHYNPVDMTYKAFFLSLLFSFGLCAEPLFQKLELIASNGPDISHIEKKAEELYQGQPISTDLLNQVRSLVIAEYQKNNHPFVLVDIHEQDISLGVVKMHVAESVLSDIQCEGNRWFRCSQLSGYLRMHKGDPIDLERLLNGLSFSNRNPFRTTSAMFQPGREKNTTDVMLVTQDRFPLRLYAGGDNTGNDFTGNARWFTGVTAGNLWLLDHTLSYQYTTSSSPHQFQSHTGQYQMPLPGNNLLMFFGGVSFVHAHLSRFESSFMPPAAGLTNKGFSGQASARLQFPFGTFWKAHLQELAFGFDFKRMNNNLIYIGDTSIPLIFKSVNLNQFMSRYFIAGDTGNHRFSFENNLYFSPGDLVGGGGDGAFNNLRENAKNLYGYGRIAIQDTYQIPHDCCLYGLLRGQWASGALLPSEQMGLGGYDTVRGYDEREFNVDQAIVFNGEFHSPSFSFIKKNKDAFFLLVFADFAAGWNYSSLSNEESSDWLGSLGAGFRYHIDRYLDARLDYGFKLNKNSTLGTSLGKLHLGLIASY